MRRRIRTLLGGQKGLGISEVLVAVAIMGFIGPAFMLAISNVSSNTNTHKGKVIAANLAQSQLEMVKAAPFDNTAPYYDDIQGVACPDADDYTITITTEPVDASKQNVTVTVSRADGSVFELSTLKVDW